MERNKGGVIKSAKSQIFDRFAWEKCKKHYQNFRPPSAARSERNKGGGVIRNPRDTVHSTSASSVRIQGGGSPGWMGDTNCQWNQCNALVSPLGSPSDLPPSPLDYLQRSPVPTPARCYRRRRRSSSGKQWPTEIRISICDGMDGAGEDRGTGQGGG